MKVSKSQTKLLELIEFLEYAPYPLLLVHYTSLNDKRRFKKNFRQLIARKKIKTIKVGKNIFVLPYQTSELFDSNEKKILAYFYYKVIRSGGEVMKDKNRIISVKGVEFTYEIFSRMDYVRLHGVEKANKYSSTSKQLEDLKLSLADSLIKIS